MMQKESLLVNLDLEDDTIDCNRIGCNNGIYSWINASGYHEGECWRCGGTARMKVEQLGIRLASKYYEWKAKRHAKQSDKARKETHLSH